MITPSASIGSSDVAAHYDELDIIYRGVWGEDVHHGLWESGSEDIPTAVANLTRRVAQAAGIQRGDRICDVGCGYGAAARLLAREWNATVSAITISKSQFDVAASGQSASERVEFVHGDWMANPFADESYDAVIAIESSEHMPDLARFYSECRRVLKPGGRLAVAAWLSAESPGSWQVRHLLEPICREGRLVGLGSEREYRELMAAEKFRDIAFEDLSDRVAQTWTRCIRRFFGALPSRADYRHILFSRNYPSRVFARTLFRLRFAYACGAMRYGILRARR